MARIDNLNNFLTDVAAAIKNKKGDQSLIKAKDFDTEIENIPTGGGKDINLYINNGTIEPQPNPLTMNTSSNIAKRIKTLPELDLTNLDKSDALHYIFYGLSGLTKTPELKIKSGATEMNLDSMFSGCRSLTNIETIKNILNGKNISQLSETLYSCESLTDFSFITKENTINNKTLYYTFDGCKQLKEAPDMTTTNVQTMRNCFHNCSKLKTIPEYDTSNCTDFGNMFNGATILASLPLLDLSSAKNVASMFYGEKIKLTDLKGFKNLGAAYTVKQTNYSDYTLDLHSCVNLTHDSIINIINNLSNLNTVYGEEKTTSTQQLILGIENLRKLSSAEIQTATDKGWTVS